MSDGMKSISFALLLCVTCSLLLTAATNGLKTYQQANILLDQRKNILKSVGLITQEKSLSNEAINRLYDSSIQKIDMDVTGGQKGKSMATAPQSKMARPDHKLPIYLYRLPSGEIQAYILPINTRGLWGKIKGYMAIEKDGATIAGFTVYKHSETPGLGGEIESSWFQKNFVGKKITDAEGHFVSIAIAKGNVKTTVPEKKRINYVDGISGATLTGKFLTSGFKNILSEYEPISICFRQKACNALPKRWQPSK